MKPSCAECPVGRASGVGQGQFCPFIVREYPRGHVLFREGEPAAYGWFVAAGAVVLSTSAHAEPVIVHPFGFLGIQCLLDQPYAATARVLEDATLCGATRDGLAQWLSGHGERICTLLRGLPRSRSCAACRDYIDERRRPMRQKITCPESAHLEDVEYTEDPIDGTILGVLRCTGCASEDIVDCDMLCVKRLNARIARRRALSQGVGDEVRPDDAPLRRPT